MATSSPGAVGFSAARWKGPFQQTSKKQEEHVGCTDQLEETMSLEQAVEEAIEYIRANEPPQGYFVAFSGGKDSMVTKELVRMAGVRHRVGYACTRIDPPELVRFIRRQHPDVEFLYPRMSFWQGVRTLSPPVDSRRWCCFVLKKQPTQHIHMPRISGIRAEESRHRASRPRAMFMNVYGQMLFKPIYHWQEWHVWQFIEERKLPYLELYDEGFGRTGCVVCPDFMGLDQRHLHWRMRRWPGMYRVFEKAMRAWFEARTQGRGKRSPASFDAYLAAYYRGFQGPDDVEMLELHRERQEVTATLN
jgi:phosphoadenosine phosphosulfate reductase